MPTATSDMHPWTTNDLIAQCVLGHEAANCFRLKVGNSPPINGQCTNFILFDVTLELPLQSKGLNIRVAFAEIQRAPRTLSSVGL